MLIRTVGRCRQLPCAILPDMENEFQRSAYGQNTPPGACYIFCLLRAYKERAEKEEQGKA
jgi:hypothetical protein